MLVSAFDEERAKINDRMTKLNRDLRQASDWMEEFKRSFVEPVMSIRNPSPVQLALINHAVDQAGNFALIFFELKKCFCQEVEKIKEVDDMERIHNELAKFKI